MIPYIEDKPYNHEKVKEYLSLSKEKNHWSNFGPLYELLERRLSLHFNHPVVVCASGTLALWAAMLYWEEMVQRKIRWAMSTFSFPCVPQNLFDIHFLDCDEQGMLDMKLTQPYEGVILTNLFGGFDMDEYRALAKEKIVLVDSAMNFNSNRHSEFEMVSFHHTKPWGFGEAGCLAVPKTKPIKSILNFGKTTGHGNYKQYSMNGKISEIACAGVLQRLDDLPRYEPIYRSQYTRIANIASELGYRVLGTNMGIPCNVPIVFDKPTTIHNNLIKLGKYYEPIIPAKNANFLYERIVNFPCHPGVTLDDQEIKSVLLKLKSTEA